MAQWVRLSLGKLTSQIQARLPALALLPLIQPPVCVLGKAADDDPRALTPVTHARDLGEVPGSWLLPDLGSGCCGRVDGQSADGRSLFFFSLSAPFSASPSVPSSYKTSNRQILQITPLLWGTLSFNGKGHIWAGSSTPPGAVGETPCPLLQQALG